MKRYIAIVFIILLCQVTHSQGKNRFSIGFDFSPAYSHFVFSSNNKSIEKLVSDKSKPCFGFSLGIPVRFDINDRFRIVSGISYVKRGTHMISKYDSLPIVNNIGFTYYLMKLEQYTNYHYFEIPIHVGVVLYKYNKTQIYVNTGFALDFLLTVTENNYLYSTDNVEHYRGTLDFQNFVRRVNYIAIGGFGVNYELTDKISLEFNPYFSYMLNDRNIDNPEDTENPNFHFYDIGFRIGTSYRF